MAETGQEYNLHPVTGEPGRWRLFQGQGYVNLDPNAPRDVYWNQRNQNYIGELGKYYAVNPNTGEVSVDEEGNPRWYFSGTLGWLNTKPAEIQPDPGPISFGDYGGALAGPTRSAEAPQQPAGDAEAGADTPDATAETEQPLAGLAGAGSVSGPSMSGAFTSLPPSGLSFQRVQLPSVAPPPKIDYVKILNSALAADVMGGMLTGRGIV